ncbi:MAG: SH3 domain-containing protein [Clostridiales bacterium]|nr:SH3 domain-containing protein [Candidatus Blautia equi]
MKKFVMAVLLMSIVLGATACGYQITEDSTVKVVRATPTPVPTPSPIPTPTPEPQPEPEVTVEYVQTALGVNIEKKDATYTTTSDVNLRKDCSTEVEYWCGVPNGSTVTSTGISEDGEWLELKYVLIDGQEVTGYIKAEYAQVVE